LDAVKSIEAAAGHPLKPEALQEAADTLIIGSFFGRQMSSRSVTEMFEEYSVLRARQKTFEDKRRSPKENPNWREYRLGEDLQRYSRLSTAVMRFGKVMDRLDRVKTKEDAKKLRKQAVTIARKVMGE